MREASSRGFWVASRTPYGYNRVMERQQDITLAISIESEPTKDDSVSTTTFTPSYERHNSNGRLRYSWAVNLDASM